MPTRLSKKGLDEAEAVNSLAARISTQTNWQELPEPQTGPERAKNAAAVALGMLGASKGGKVRAENLSERRRRSIAKQAAIARWKKRA